MGEKICITLFCIFSAFLATAEPLFYAPFDSNVDATIAAGEKNARTAGNIRYVDGIRGDAVVVGGLNRVLFSAGKNINIKQGSCSFWTAPQNCTTSTNNFIFFVSFLAHQGIATSDILIYKICQSANLTLLVRNAKTEKSNSLFQDIALWQPGKWHNIVFTWSNEKIVFYLDGKEVSSMTRFLLPEKWEDIVLGIAYPAWAMLGEEEIAIDELSIFQECLSAADVESRYQDMMKANAKPADEHKKLPSQEDVFYSSFDSGIAPDKAKSCVANTFNKKILSIPGIKGSAVTLAGPEDLEISYAGSNLSTKQGTCIIWIKPEWNATEKNHYFFVSFFGTDGRLMLYKTVSSPELALLVEGYSPQKTVAINKTIAVWQPDNWHQLAFTWENHIFRLYVDGEFVNSRKGPEVNHWSNIVIGTAYPAWGNVGKMYTGFDEFSIYPYAMDKEQIKSGYNKIIDRLPVLKKEIKSNQKKRVEMLEKNLALGSNKGWIIASSFDDYDTSYPDNLIDNDPETIWSPRENEYPQYLELRWKYPRKINKIAWEPSFRGQLTAASILAWNQATGDWRLIKKLSQDELKKHAASFATESTDRIRLELEKGVGDKIILSEIAALGPDQPIVGKTFPYWDAWYVWYPEPDKVHKASRPRYFRHTFTLDDASFKTAYILARSNDYYCLWINGQEVARGSTQISPFEVTSLLKKGINSITAEADLRQNPGEWGWGELIIELSINYPDRTVRIGTGPKWKSFDRKITGWNNTVFDDSAWPSVFCYKSPPEGPWGAIPYFFTGVQEKCNIDNVELPRMPIAAGREFDVEVKLSSSHPLKNDFFWIFEIGRDSEDNCRVVSRQVIDYVKVNDGEKSFALKARLALPPFTPSGKQPLIIRGYNRKTGNELELNGTESGRIGFIQVTDRPAMAPASGEAKIAYTNGQASFVIDQKVTTPLFWRYVHQITPEMIFTLNESTGIKIHHFTIYGRLIDIGEKPWMNRIKTLEEQLDVLFALCPDAYAMVQTDMRPTMQWLQENPRECLVNAFGELDTVTFASVKYRELCRQMLKDMLTLLKTKPYWNRIIGFQPFSCGVPDSGMGGVGGNVWQKDRTKITAGDYNPQAIEKFRNFLRKKYDNNVKELRLAWKTPEVSFESAIPKISQLVAEGRDGGVFRDPTEGMMPFDYAEFLPTLLGGFTAEMARFIKDETGWKKMVFVHYGFIIEHMRSVNNPGSELNNNNYDLAEMLKDPSIDGYIGAPCYSNRLAGTPIVTYFPWSSFFLHKRMYLPDDDNRPFIAGQKDYGRNHSRRETRAIISRNIGADITRNFGSWFSDLKQGADRMSVSWTGEKEIVPIFSGLNKLYERAIKTGYHSASEIAVVFSCESPKFLDIYYGATLNYNLIPLMFYSDFFKLGAPFDVYLASDLKNANFPKHYKLFVMMNLFQIPKEDRQAIEALKKDGKTILWFYAPGYVDTDNGLDSKNISVLTGIKTQKLLGKEQMKAALSNDKHQLSDGLKLGHEFSSFGFSYPDTAKLHPSEFGPRFRIVDPDAQIIACFADGKGAIAARDFGTWKSVYSVIPRLDWHFLRNVCQWAGVHIYTDKEIIFDANQNFIVLHNGYNSAKKIILRLPRKTNVINAMDGKKLGENVNSLELLVEECSTTILYLNSAFAD